MTYLLFRGMMMFMSIMGLVTMMTLGDYKYVLFPLAMLAWVIFSFFDENDKEYLRRNNINPDSKSWFFPEDDGYYNYGYNDSYYEPRRQSYGRKHTTVIKANVQDPEYKKIVKRCKKNVEVTIDKINRK